MWVHTQEALLGVRADLAPGAQPPADSAWQPAEPSAREGRLASALVSMCQKYEPQTEEELAAFVQAKRVLASPEAPAKEDALEARHARVREAAEALVAKLDAVDDAVAGAFAFAALHGMAYSGPNYADELSALRAALETP